MRVVLVVVAFLAFAHGLNIPDNGASGRSPSLDDPCSQVPCGQNAMCDVTPGGIAYCHCQPGHVGDPFAGCKSTEGLNPSTSATFNIPHQQTNLGSTKNDASPSPPRFTVEFVESSSTDGGINSNRRLPILASEASMEPQESHKRVEGVGMQSSSAIVHESVVQSQETRRRPALPTVITTSDMYPPPPPPRPQTFEHPPPNHHPSGSEVTDPMGQYSNCRNINNAIVCADTTNFVEGSSGGGRHQPPKQHVDYPHHHHPASILISKLGSPGGGGGSLHDDVCRGRCGVDEICRVVNNGPVCGSKGSSSSFAKDTSSSYCQKHVDCPTTQVCSQHTCVDPCTTTPSEGGERLVCGGNARCIVIQHSPLCGCNEGLKGNPYVACA